MLCPNCKNPIKENSRECEWCGEVISTNTPKTAHSGFVIEFEKICCPAKAIGPNEANDLILVGNVKSGEIKIGDRFYLTVNGNEPVLGVCKGLYDAHHYGATIFVFTGKKQTHSVKYGEKVTVVTNINKKEIGLNNMWKVVHNIQGKIISINE